MVDLSDSIIAKSDQLNADDLIGRSITIEITNVSGKAGDQPIAISFKGDEGKPYLPCKSMRRVLAFVWGTNGKAFVGRSLTLYRDPGVKFGGLEVGGIRISHMSHIDKPVSMALTATRGSKKAFTVQPLVAAAIPLDELRLNARTAALSGTASLEAFWKGLGGANQKKLADIKDELKKTAAECDAPPATGDAA